MKWLIVNADDFGASPGINRGILEAHRNGILTSTSVLVHRAASFEVKAVTRSCPDLSLGLHLELELAEPARIRQQLDDQLTRFVELVGSPPTHVDSHHDLHRDFRIVPHVRAWADQQGLPLRGFSRARQLSRFYGRWGGRSHPEQINGANLLALVDAEIGEGIIELTCHPGYVEPEFETSYAAEREIEVRTLCSDTVRQGLLAREIHLIGFRDMPAEAVSAS
jgi:chitin disaccharide deacetylase